MFRGDLRASLVAQQKQLDTLVDRVAVLLSSMHAEAPPGSHQELQGLKPVTSSVL